MEMEIQKRRVENKITYAEAAKQVKGQARDQRSQSGVSKIIITYVKNWRWRSYHKLL